MRVSSAEGTEQTSSPSHTHQHSQLCTQHCQTLDLAPHVVRQLGKCSQGFEATSAEKTGARYGSTHAQLWSPVHFQMPARAPHALEIFS